jgi:hypothetical protein
MSIRAIKYQNSPLGVLRCLLSPGNRVGKQRGNLLRFLVVVRELTARVPHPLHERSRRLDDFRASLAAREVLLVERRLARVHPLHHELLGCFHRVSRTGVRMHVPGSFAELAGIRQARFVLEHPGGNQIREVKARLPARLRHAAEDFTAVNGSICLDVRAGKPLRHCLCIAYTIKEAM